MLDQTKCFAYFRRNSHAMHHQRLQFSYLGTWPTTATRDHSTFLVLPDLMKRPNGLPISRAATDRSGKRLSHTSFQKSDDLADAKRRRLHGRVGRLVSVGSDLIA